MQIVRTTAALRDAVAGLRRDGGTIGLVPTMGALHAGHIALMAEARSRATHLVTSIFVNPMQFGAGEDFDAYPRQEAADAARLREAGCALLWAPSPAEVYPTGFATTVSVSGIGDRLEGAARPGHFDGVATVVAKLFAQVRPDIAVFGEKDYQQLAVIRRIAADLDSGVDVIGLPTVRDVDGLALSSRNAYLTEPERAAAVALPDALRAAAAAIIAGGPVTPALDAAKGRLAAAGFAPVDYVELCDAATLEPLERLDRPARLLAAARIGRTRLIDNVSITPAQ